MAQKYLRNTADGTIYRWDPILAANPKCVEVSEEDAFPARTAQKRRATRKRKEPEPQLDLFTDLDGVQVEEESMVDIEIREDASRGLPE